MVRIPSRRFITAGILFALLWAPEPAPAHDFSFIEAQATLGLDGSFQVDFLADLDALLLGLPPGSLTPEDYEYLLSLDLEEIEKRTERVRQHFIRTVRLRFDGEVMPPQIDFPPDPPSGDTPDDAPRLLSHTARLTGQVPDGAREFTFTASRMFGPVILSLGWEGGEFVLVPLQAGATSPPFALDRPQPPPTRLQIARRYLAVGFVHIVPRGLDHMLFVLGLFLLSVHWRPLLVQVTSFTLAHSLSLALSMYGVARLPASVVEPLIALSIAYVAVENLLTSELKPWRPAVVFAFGLLHGLGFAGVLAEWGLPKGEFLTALVTFNLGVELGQLAVLALAFGTVGWFRRRPWYRARVIVPCSVVIALVGIYWAVERALA